MTVSAQCGVWERGSAIVFWLAAAVSVLCQGCGSDLSGARSADSGHSVTDAAATSQDDGQSAVPDANPVEPDVHASVGDARLSSDAGAIEAGAGPGTNHADDTHACLSQLNGPLEVVANANTYTDFIRSSWSQLDVRFDARNARWRHQTVPDKAMQSNWMIQLGGNWKAAPQARMCWAGGVVVGTNDPQLPWGSVKQQAGEALFFNATGGIVDGVRIHNVGEDGIGVIHGDNFAIKNVWVSDIFDDCVENDHLGDGRIEDSLFDGCFMGLSIDPGGKTNIPGKAQDTVVIDRVLMRTRKVNMGDRPRYDDDGLWFKTKTSQASEIGLAIYDSVLAFSGFPAGTTSGPPVRLQKAWERTRKCRNNVIAWLSDDPLPANFPKPPSCFRIVQGQKARTLWAKAKQNWINCHPALGRAPGDPVSDVNACDPQAYGGGNTL